MPRESPGIGGRGLGDSQREDQGGDLLRAGDLRLRYREERESQETPQGIGKEIHLLINKARVSLIYWFPDPSQTNFTWSGGR